ncbi:hypothetical protein LTS02_017527 [Friedmanniomyces endolithicus]|nr:hypothetical protein LTS02_017527 [Friedmanniomyces endolithicus]
MTIIVPSACAIDVLHQRIEALRETIGPRHRIIIALAGAPGSGKSTIAAKLLSRLAVNGVHDIAVMPMVIQDGFLRSKAALATFEDPVTALRRRGTPYTFDAAAFVTAVKVLRAVCVTAIDEPCTSIRIPSFDHAIQDPVPDDICVSSTVRVLIVEGNYTLFNQPPWNEMVGLAIEKWFVDVPRSVAMLRLAKRHILAGVETTMEAAEARVEKNDLPNGDMIRENLINPDIILQG